MEGTRLPQRDKLKFGSQLQEVCAHFSVRHVSNKKNDNNFARILANQWNIKIECSSHALIVPEPVILSICLVVQWVVAHLGAILLLQKTSV